VPVDIPLGDPAAEEFDALVLPGGVMNPDKLRINEWALQFVRAFFEGRCRWAVVFWPFRPDVCRERIGALFCDAWAGERPAFFSHVRSVRRRRVRLSVAA
jgi:hypothetical protein